MLTGGTYVPERGDVVRITWNRRDGQGEGSRGPAMVLSTAAYNGKIGLALFCPITERVKGYPFEVKIPARLEVSGAILSDQVKSLDWRALQAEPICRLPGATVAEVLRKTSVLLAK